MISGLLLSTLVSAQDGAGFTGSSTPGAIPYQCPTTCQPPSCVCASTSPPGGLTLSQTPQFITLTFDDATQPDTMNIQTKLMNSFTNPNGCPLPGTYFVSMQYTDFWETQRAFNLGNEIASHTVNHLNLTTVKDPTNEINATLTIMSKFGGVPKSKIRGFRSPYLSFNKLTFDTISKLKFLYDSSVTLDPNTQPFWPHTLDYGMPYDAQPCSTCAGASMVYPGLWEIPMYYMVGADSKTVWTSMDPPAPYQTSYTDSLNLLKLNFKLHYAKKLPFGLYTHLSTFVASGPIDPAHIAMFSDFYKWILLNYPDVWFVTNQQLIEWIKTPVSIDKMNSMFPCVLPAVDPKNSEICDGIDNDGDGVIDNGLVESCYQASTQSSFNSCFGCPSVFPTANNPAPPVNSSSGGMRVTIPDTGCPGLGSWDPVKGVCAQLIRLSVPSFNSNSTKPPVVQSSFAISTKFSYILGACGMFLALLF